MIMKIIRFLKIQVVSKLFVTAKNPECESVQDFYLLPFHYSLFTKIAFRIFGK